MTCATPVLPLDPISVQHATGSIRSFEGGAGDPVVLLHGLGGSAANWALVADSLVGSLRVVAFDLPGHGGSDPLPRDAGVDEYADAVAAAIAARVEGPALVAGHSFGGQIALRLAERNPGLVRALLLVVSSGVASLPRRTAMAGQITSVIRPRRWVAPFAARFAERVWFRAFAFPPVFLAGAAP